VELDIGDITTIDNKQSLTESRLKIEKKNILHTGCSERTPPNCVLV